MKPCGQHAKNDVQSKAETQQTAQGVTKGLKHGGGVVKQNEPIHWLLQIGLSRAPYGAVSCAQDALAQLCCGI